jgi:hypothetical protein
MENKLPFYSLQCFIVVDTTDIMLSISKWNGKCSIVTTTDTIVIHKYLKDVMLLLPEIVLLK